MSQDFTVDQDKAPEQRGESAHAARLHIPLGDRIPPTIDHADGHTGKRKRTGGEVLFDTTTYGGFALVGNEVVSTYIVKAAEKPTAFGRFFDRVSEITKKIGPEGKVPYTQSGRFNYINFAIIGGFTMVPIIKFLEDNKGRLVRAADSIIHGVQADNDPAIRSAHEEMDNAPKQTWGSLMKGRILTVLAAWGVDASINWKDGWSARALKGSKLEKFSSLEAVTGRVADKMGDAIATRRGMDVAKATNLKSWLNQGFGLLSLSATLTAIFYVTSKFFAKRHDDRREIYDEIHTTRAEHVAATEALQTEVKKDDVPVPTVSAIAHEARLAATPELGREA